MKTSEPLAVEDLQRIRWQAIEGALRFVRDLVAEGWTYEQAVCSFYGTAVKTLAEMERDETAERVAA